MPKIPKLVEEIYQHVIQNPGLKAREISLSINQSKKIVNNILYGQLKDHVRQNDEYKWTAINTTKTEKIDIIHDEFSNLTFKSELSEKVWFYFKNLYLNRITSKTAQNKGRNVLVGIENFSKRWETSWKKMKSSITELKEMGLINTWQAPNNLGRSGLYTHVEITKEASNQIKKRIL